MRYFLRISFNGGPFHGWQIQQNADSVQSQLNIALKIFLRREVETTGCGRTDTGVHAKMFFVHFDSDKEINPETFIRQINSILPGEIAVHSLFAVDDAAHARFGAVSRTYEYYIYNRKNPFLENWAWFIPYEADIEKMNALTDLLSEHTDFSCFSKSNTQTLTNNCKIINARWSRSGEKIIFKITADRFLRNMVRAIVGTMLQAGEGKLSGKDFKKILESKDRREAGVSVPAHGLYLTEVVYPFNVY